MVWLIPTIIAVVGVAALGWIEWNSRHAQEDLEIPKIRSVTIVGAGFYDVMSGWSYVRRVEGARLVRREVIDSLVDEANLGHVARKDKAWCDEIEASVRAEGFHYAFTIVIDTAGGVCLKDGHHRLIVARRIGLPVVPVAVAFSNGTIRKHHRHVQDLAREFWSV